MNPHHAQNYLNLTGTDPLAQKPPRKWALFEAGRQISPEEGTEGYKNLQALRNDKIRLGIDKKKLKIQPVINKAKL